MVLRGNYEWEFRHLNADGDVVYQAYEDDLIFTESEESMEPISCYKATSVELLLVVYPTGDDREEREYFVPNPEAANLLMAQDENGKFPTNPKDYKLAPAYLQTEFNEFRLAQSVAFWNEEKES